MSLDHSVYLVDEQRGFRERRNTVRALDYLQILRQHYTDGL